MVHLRTVILVLIVAALGVGVFLFVGGERLEIDESDVFPPADSVAPVFDEQPSDTSERGMDVQEVSEPQVSDAMLLSSFNNSTVRIPGEERPVTFKYGSGVIVYGTGATERTRAEVATALYLRDSDVLASVLTVRAGGSGTFYWLVLYEVRDDGTFIKVDEVYLGDRIAVDGLWEQDGVVRLSMREHGERQSYVEVPNVEKEFRYVVSDKRLNPVVSE